MLRNSALDCSINFLTNSNKNIFQCWLIDDVNNVNNIKKDFFKEIKYIKGYVSDSLWNFDVIRFW